MWLSLTCMTKVWFSDDFPNSEFFNSILKFCTRGRGCWDDRSVLANRPFRGFY
jgi:hypothetical protein